VNTISAERIVQGAGVMVIWGKISMTDLAVLDCEKVYAVGKWNTGEKSAAECYGEIGV